MITFTIQQVNELLQALGQLPYVYSKNLIDGINAIAQAQMKESVAKNNSLMRLKSLIYHYHSVVKKQHNQKDGRKVN